jgi:thiamine biosynthesis lipoprotein
MRGLFVLIAVTACAGIPAPEMRTEAPAAQPPDGPAVADLGDGFWEIRFPTMGTWISLTVRAPDGGAARALAAAAREELLRLDALLSEWRDDSPVSAVNRAAGGAPVRVPEELLALVERSLEAAARSQGAFDPTWAAMRGLWKIGDAMDGTVPHEDEIEAARRLEDFRKVRVDRVDGAIFLEEEGMALGLGGIAKGYAVDRLASLLRARGCEDFVIRLGGDLFAAGTRGTRRWRAGVQDPRDPGRVFAVLVVEDRAFSTSGDYERFFVKDGVRYHHIIDPSTGRPALASRSVTALCPDAITAEVVTKPVFILGAEKGIPLAEAWGCEVLVVDAENRVHVSAGLRERLDWAMPTP